MVYPTEWAKASVDMHASIVKTGGISISMFVLGILPTAFGCILDISWIGKELSLDMELQWKKGQSSGHLCGSEWDMGMMHAQGIRPKILNTGVMRPFGRKQ